jgi:hypothetical protein
MNPKIDEAKAKEIIKQGISIFLGLHRSQFTQGLQSYIDMGKGGIASDVFMLDILYYILLGVLVATLKQHMPSWSSKIKYLYTGRYTYPFEQQTRRAFEQTIRSESATSNETPFLFYDFKLRKLQNPDKAGNNLVWTYARNNASTILNTVTEDTTDIALINNTTRAITSTWMLTPEDFDPNTVTPISMDHNNMRAFSLDFEYLEPSGYGKTLRFVRYLLFHKFEWIELLLRKNLAQANMRYKVYGDCARLCNWADWMVEPEEINNVLELKNDLILMEDILQILPIVSHTIFLKAQAKIKVNQAFRKFLAEHYIKLPFTKELSVQQAFGLTKDRLKELELEVIKSRNYRAAKWQVSEEQIDQKLLDNDEVRTFTKFGRKLRKSRKRVKTNGNGLSPDDLKEIEAVTADILNEMQED